MALTVLVKAQGGAPSEITGLYKYFCKCFITQSVEDPWTREEHSSLSPYFVSKVPDSDIYLVNLKKICRSALDSPGADPVF